MYCSSLLLRSLGGWERGCVSCYIWLFLTFIPPGWGSLHSGSFHLPFWQWRWPTLLLSFPTWHFLSFLVKYLTGMKPGSLRLVSYLEGLKGKIKDRERERHVVTIPAGDCSRENGDRGLSNKLENPLTFQLWWMTRPPVFACFPHICQHSAFSKHFSMISDSLTAALGVRKKQKLFQFLYYLYQTMFSVSKISFCITDGAFFPFEGFPCEAL